MNGDEAPKGPAASHRVTDAPGTVARPPELVITLGLEASPRLQIVADHEGDALRLRAWAQTQPDAIREAVQRWACPAATAATA